MSKFIKLTKLDIKLKHFKSDLSPLKGIDEERELYKQQYKTFASDIENYSTKKSVVCVNSDEIQLLSKRANLGELIHLDATPPDDLHLGTCIQLKGGVLHEGNHRHMYLIVEESPEQILSLIQEMM
ncbi:hypothetical protein [Mannheimia haemolytica]|uniref:hypothetical protein n=1 Tax=Mannheimia haemolytica TaxID=75985 RepID=UPI001CF36411|nr:hypothetical protein [Mannheimia haemolytica]MCB4227897.1 hypothetical protein [Mannheimia haemolytica]